MNTKKMPKSKPKPKGAKGEEGRAANGRFMPGYKGGPGNPYGAYVEKLRVALYAAVSAKDIADIAKAQIEKALEGNTYAAQFVFDRVLGKPAQPITGADGGALRVETNDPRFAGVTDDELKAIVALATANIGKKPSK